MIADWSELWSIRSITGSGKVLSSEFWVYNKVVVCVAAPDKYRDTAGTWNSFLHSVMFLYLVSTLLLTSDNTSCFKGLHYRLFIKDFLSRSVNISFYCSSIIAIFRFLGQVVNIVNVYFQNCKLFASRTLTLGIFKICIQRGRGRHEKCKFRLDSWILWVNNLKHL